MNDKLPISLIIIAHNEEKKLHHCLNSASSWVSEIIAVINDCTDKTREILESYGAQVHEYPWNGFTVQKNRALQLATQPWILSLDADEEVSPRLARSIFDFFNSHQLWSYQGIYFPRKTWFMGRWITHGDWYPDYVLRLFQKDKSAFQGGMSHEKVVVEGKLLKLRGNLLHYSFDDIGHMISKFPRYGSAFLQDKIQSNKTQFSIIKTLFRSFWRFFRCYIIRLGFLDGYPGLFISFNQAFYTLFRYSYLYEYSKKNTIPKQDKEDQ